MKKARVLFITLLFVIAMTGRAQESSPVGEVPGLTNITWRLIGFGTVGEDDFQKVEPQDSTGWYQKYWEYVYTVLFTKDGTLYARSWTNEIHANYNIQDENISITHYGYTKVGELYDGLKYWDYLRNVTAYMTDNDRLYLYHNNRQNYLLYRKAKQVPKLLVEGRRWVYRDSWPDDDALTEEQKAKGEVSFKAAIHSVSLGDYTGFVISNLFPNRWILDTVENVTDTISLAYEELGEKVVFYNLHKDSFHQKIKTDSGWSFDFGIAIGGKTDMEAIPSMDYVKVRADTIEVNSRRFAREIWKLGDDEIPIVEGVGCPTGLLVFEDTDNGCKTEFLGCYDGDELVFSPEDFYRPAVSAGISMVTLSPSPQDQQLFDLQGRRLAAPPAKGLYIQGGRLKSVK